MAEETMGDVVVTQADRDAADAFTSALRMGGLGDGVGLAQRFARHRIAATRPAPSEASGDVVEAVCANCKGMFGDLASGREPEEFCDTCYEDSQRALSTPPIEQSGLAGELKSRTQNMLALLDCKCGRDECTFLAARDLITDLATALTADNARDEALEEAAKAAYDRLFPKNPRSDWTAYARDMADAAVRVRKFIRSLKGAAK